MMFLSVICNSLYLYILQQSFHPLEGFQIDLCFQLKSNFPLTISVILNTMYTEIPMVVMYTEIPLVVVICYSMQWPCLFLRVLLQLTETFLFNILYKFPKCLCQVNLRMVCSDMLNCQTPHHIQMHPNIVIIELIFLSQL